MTDAAEQMKDRLLQLPDDDRAELANFLFDSLPTEHADAWDDAWSQECERRWRAVESGEAKLIPAEEVHREVRARLEQLREER